MLSCFAAFQADAQQGPSYLRIRNGEIALPANAARWLDSFYSRATGPALVFLQFETLPDAESRRQLSGAGIRLHNYLSNRTFIATIEKGKGARSSAGISSIVPVDASRKLAPGLHMQPSSKAVDVVISFLPGTPPEVIKEQIIALEGSFLPSPLASHGCYEASLPAKALTKLAADANVLYIGPAAKDVPLNLESQRATKANVAHAPASSGGWGLLGDSITIGVGDNVPGLFHIDLRDRIINYNPQGYGNHGQHVNGTVGGAGTVDPIGEGFAPHATIIDHLYSLVWARTGAMLQAHNMTVTNNSYANSVGSCADAGIYDVYSQVLDTFVLLYPEVFQVFAAGNDGGMTCAPYPTSYATVPGGYQAAKNVLVVANATKQYDANPGTSRGPMRDGRLKPEIAAIGTNISSTKGGDTYLGASGTSMACPQVAGSAALLQQRYKQLHAGAYPSSALTKALLMNGAVDIGTPGPDYTFGYGLVDLTRSLIMMDSNRYLTGSISQGASQTPATIAVPPNTGQLKVMLYWHDVPSSPLAATQLVNDLDLKVSDPGSVNHLPFVLNPAAAGVAVAAAHAADHLNNVEQVVIDNPAAGNYVVNVAGYGVPYGPQDYVVAYDLIPAGISLTTPFKDGAYKSGDPLTIYWNASPSSNTFTIEFSSNNGGSWTTLNSSVPSTDRQYAWTPGGGVNSAQCLVRILRNSTAEQATSGAFTINDQSLLQLSGTQCPGYAAMHWSPVPNATAYTVLRKIGPYLQPTVTVNDTFYTASGLSLDSNYYFSVQPLFGAAKGYRCVAVNRVPNSGTCAGNISDADLMLEKIVSPASGRLFTSTALSSSQSLDIRLRNLDDAASGSYRVSCQLNGGAWSSQTLSSLPANSTALATFTGLNMAAPGAYLIRAAITNLSATDGVSRNDTIVRVVRQLQNGAINLAAGYMEGFEGAARLTLQADTTGFTPDEHWDYFNSDDTARLRSFVDGDITISGTRSISMDLVQNANPVFSKLTGTFNLATANVATDEVRFEFDYKLHGRPRTADSNRVWVRGDDTEAWAPLFDYDRSRADGSIINSGTLSLTDALASAGQAFSSSTQIAFGFRDTSVIAQNDYGNGLTLDNVKLYQVVNDAAITAVVSPVEAGCELPAATPLTITVYNGVTATLTDIFLYYQLDGGAIVTDTLGSIAGKMSIPFTFTRLMNTASYGPHTLNIWLVAANDSYHQNDSIIGYVFRNEPLIAAFPYLQNFELGEGYWYSGGVNNSWAFGTPASADINKAAGGTKAWKTNLSGHYNDNELSYLYSPCFDIGGLSNPMLSFSVAMEIENCGQFLCDGAWVEYSANGGPWTKLGAAGQGTNWYTDPAFQVWNTQSGVRWKAASIALPAVAQPVRFRIVMSSDAGASLDGLAIDDIHIYDRVYPLYTGPAVGPVSRVIGSGGSYTSFTSGGAVLAQINPAGSNPGNTEATLYAHSNIIDAASSQYYLPKNFVVNTQNPLTDSVTARLYISDADVLTLVNATGCAGCSKPADAYELGITKYDNSNISLENGSLSDNAGGAYMFIPYTRISWVPYDAGYYAEVKLASFSELWFNSGGAAHSFPLPIASVEFNARKVSPESVLTTWLSHVDTQVTNYEVQRSENAMDFNVITTVSAVHDNAQQYSYVDMPGNIIAQALYYRLRYKLLDGRDYYSPMRQIIWSGKAAAVQVYPNPTSDGKLSIHWSTTPDAKMDIVVTDVVGKVVLRADAKAPGYSNTTQVNLGNISRGMYFLRATVAGERFEFKIEVM
jgi:hypothetical protein